jgi:hypothetical protein
MLYILTNVSCANLLWSFIFSLLLRKCLFTCGVFFLQHLTLCVSYIYPYSFSVCFQFSSLYSIGVLCEVVPFLSTSCMFHATVFVSYQSRDLWRRGVRGCALLKSIVSNIFWACFPNCNMYDFIIRSNMWLYVTQDWSIITKLLLFN